MWREIVSRTPRIRKSKSGFLLLLLSIAHLPLLRQVDARILRGDLVTGEVTDKQINRSENRGASPSARLGSVPTLGAVNIFALRIMPRRTSTQRNQICLSWIKELVEFRRVSGAI
jgi:hypothetical protein